MKERLGPHRAFGADADGRTDDQTATGVLDRVGILLVLVDVLDGDQPAQPVVHVHHQQLLDAVLVQFALGLFVVDALGHGDQVAGGHQFGHERGVVLDEPDVAVGDDAHQMIALDHGQTGNAVFGHDGFDLAQVVVRVNGDGVGDHA